LLKFLKKLYSNTKTVVPAIVEDIPEENESMEVT